jgi:ankyrin repeat protein
LTDAEKVEFTEIRKNAYKTEIDTVISACTAASEDDIEGMRSLRKAGVNLNIGDYDNRTPIHVAVATGRIKAVKYLIEEAGVIVSPVDRWHSTPMNDAEQFPPIFKYLQTKGAFIGKKWPYVVV